jgi:UDP-arabinose 4-epimerase
MRSSDEPTRRRPERRMRNVVVTGGAGYIGSHACKALAQEGYTPVAFDNLIRGNRWAVKYGPLELGDILDRAKLDEVFQRYQPKAVLHFAAYAYVGESVEDPGKYYRNNVAGTLTLLEAMRDHGVKKLVFSSTCATYGNPESTPITEDHPQRPINPYGRSKLIVEQMLRDFDQTHDIKSISLRYFNAAGADPEGEIGEAHDPETHLIPLILDVALGKRPFITVFGDDYDTPDGTCIRDYIHVTDLAEAHLLALHALEDGAQSAAFNLGNGQGFSVKEIIAEAERVTQRQIKSIIGPRRDGDPAALVGDSSLAMSKLNWKPELNHLGDIIHTSWEWHEYKAHRGASNAADIVQATK